MSWKEEAERLKFDEGKSWTEVAEAVKSYFPDMTSKQRWETVRSALRRSERYRPEKVKPKPKTPNIEVVQNLEPSIKTVDWKGNRIVRFALMGDTQINSKYTQITHLHSFYDEAEKRGIKHIYHTGDIDEGDQMRMGHQFECYNQGADDHVDEIVRVYPKRDGVTTHFITGNHDASIKKRSGHDIGKAIAKLRPDMEYLGQDCALIYLTPNCTLELRHPWDGTAYAISYKIQKNDRSHEWRREAEYLSRRSLPQTRVHSVSQRTRLSDRHVPGSDSFHEGQGYSGYYGRLDSRDSR